MIKSNVLFLTSCVKLMFTEQLIPLLLHVNIQPPSALLKATQSQDVHPCVIYHIRRFQNPFPHFHSRNTPLYLSQNPSIIHVLACFPFSSVLPKTNPLNPSQSLLDYATICSQTNKIVLKTI